MEGNVKKVMVAVLTAAVLVLLTMMMALCFSSCSRRMYTTSSVNIKDSTIYHYRDSVTEKTVTHRRDSFVIHDSVVIVVNDQGDIIRSEYYRDRDRITSLLEEVSKLHDMLDVQRSIRTDTITIPVPAERRQTRFERFTGNIKTLALIALVFLFFVKVLYPYLRNKIKK